MKIHVGIMCQNELTELIDNINQLLPYIDTINIVDGGSIDKTITYMRNWSNFESKIRFFIHPWKDHFPNQRTNYLKHISEVASDGDWIVTCDPDEVFDEEACKNFCRLVGIATKHGANTVGFRCRSVSLKGQERIWVNEDEYWKRLMFKWEPNLQYVHSGFGPVHEFLIKTSGPIRRIIMDTGLSRNVCPETYFYEHRKQEGIVAIHGMRNLFIGGGGPNLGRSNPRWIELRSITDTLKLDTWHSFYTYLLQGNIDKRIKDWMIKYKNVNEKDGDSEHREVYISYFRILHPEEEPEEFKKEHIS